MATIPKGGKAGWIIPKPSTYKPGENADFYNSAPWRKLRAVFRKRHPLCKHCEEKGVITPAYEVDHIKPISKGGERLAWSNLQSLCKRCHSVKTARERGERVREPQDGEERE